MLAFYKKSFFPLFIAVFFLALGFQAHAQSGGSSTSVTGTVVDPTGAVVPNAVVEIRNPVSGFERTVTTDSAGKFTIPNIPFNPYHLTVDGVGLRPLCSGRGCSIHRSRDRQRDPPDKGFGGNRDGGSGGRGSAGEHFDLSHRRGSRLVRQDAARKPVVVGEFAGHIVFSRNRRRFQWSLPWLGRSRGKLLLRRRPAHH